MNWRDRLKLLFGVATTANLLAAPEQALASTTPQASNAPSQQELPVFSSPSERAALLQLAQHRSHSSHSSHRSHYSGSGGHLSHTSHSSHYSGSGGGGYAPPVYAPSSPRTVSPPPAPAPAPYVGSGAVRPLASDPTQTRPLTQAEVRDFVQRVQIALMIKGYDPGPTDGHLGPRTQAALRQYQTDNSLAVSGYLDVDTVRRLGVSP